MIKSCHSSCCPCCYFPVVVVAPVAVTDVVVADVVSIVFSLLLQSSSL